jgi:MOB kinase activator 1
MDMEPHLNSSFKHFIFFAQEFQILSTTELEPLQPCIDVLTRK